MTSTNTNDNIECPVALITSNLVLVPTPIAVSSPSYRAFYASLHADATFCQMGFGHHFPARSWSDEETYQIISTRDVNNDWKKRGVGDFAVGSWDQIVHEGIFGDGLAARTFSVPGIVEEARVLDYDGAPREFDAALEAIEWVGYAGIREARDVEDTASWKEKVEIRYGVSPKHWGKGIANQAAQVVMAWAVEERAITKFIAETERLNTRSERVLERLGFVQLKETKYWKEPSQAEWERVM